VCARGTCHLRSLRHCLFRGRRLLGSSVLRLVPLALFLRSSSRLRLFYFHLAVSVLLWRLRSGLAVRLESLADALFSLARSVLTPFPPTNLSPFCLFHCLALICLGGIFWLYSVRPCLYLHCRYSLNVRLSRLLSVTCHVTKGDVHDNDPAKYSH